MTDNLSAPDRSEEREPANLDTSTPHTARVWNYWLGGKDNFAADREAGDAVAQMLPAIVDSRGRTGHSSAAPSGTWPARQGIRQFLDVGTGLPTADNTHEVAQSVAPDARIVYVDNDPLVLVHARALLTSTPEGATDYIDADLRDPDKILRPPAETLDFTQPVAVTVLGSPALHPRLRRGPRHRQPAARRRAVRQLPGDRPCHDEVTPSRPRAIRQFWNERGATADRLPQARRSPRSSRAWNCSNLAWSRARAGGPTPGPSRSRPRCSSSAASAASPDLTDSWRTTPFGRHLHGSDREDVAQSVRSAGYRAVA